ncbi:MAG: sensor histidine kinase, partial [Desulfovibrionales bacterium]
MDCKKEKSKAGKSDAFEGKAATQEKAGEPLFSDLIHELRTPLSGILGISELRLAREIPDEIRNDFSMIKDSASALLELVNLMSDISRIESGTIDLKKDLIDLNGALDELQLFFDLHSRGKPLDFSARLNPEVPPTIVGDRARLLQILKNLLMSAVRCTSKGSVFLSVAPLAVKGDHVRLAFTITASGITLPGSKQREIHADLPGISSGLSMKLG